MPRKIVDRLTVITPQQFLETLGHAWVNRNEKQAEKHQLLVLMAQSALETGRWKYVHNYNFGNEKSVEGDGRDYAFYACNEILSSSSAASYEASSTSDKPARITEKRQDGKSVIWFYPEHPGCRFRAYQVLAEDGTVDEYSSRLAGMSEYLGLLMTRFKSSWKYVLQGDPEGFVNELHRTNYFTADLEGYRKSVKSLFNEFSKTPFDYACLPVLSDSQKKEVMASVQLSIRNSVEEILNDREDLKNS